MIENNSFLKYKPRSEIVKLSYYSENDSFGILVIYINRPGKLNALSENVLSELINVFDYYLDNDIVRGIILTGSGDKANVPGYSVAGKTGTAEDSTGGSDHAWFVCFAPYEDSEIVVVAFAQNTPGGGSVHALPMAALVLKAWQETLTFKN